MKYLKKFESNNTDIEGVKLMLDKNGYQLYLVESKEGVINLYDDEQDGSWFDSYNTSSYMYCIITDNSPIYTFFIDRDDHEIVDIEEMSRPAFSPDLDYVEDDDPFAYEIMIKTRDSYNIDNVMRKINESDDNIHQTRSDIPILSYFDFKNMIFDRDGFKIFLIEYASEIKKLDYRQAISYSDIHFDECHKYNYIYLIFRNDKYLYTLLINRENNSINYIESYGGEEYKITDIESLNPTAYKLIKSIQKSHDTYRVVKQINESNEDDFLPSDIRDCYNFIMDRLDKFNIEYSNEYVGGTAMPNYFRIYLKNNNKGIYMKGRLIKIGDEELSTICFIDGYGSVLTEDLITTVSGFITELSEAFDIDVYKTVKKINTHSPIIKEFWEWSKSSYGQDKSNKDAQTSIVSFNSQNGYGEEGQWVQTQSGDVFIEEILDGNYKGFDREGLEKSGSIKDIIRTLMKKEVIKESKKSKNTEEEKYGCVMLFFDTDNIVFNEIQKSIKNEDIYKNANEHVKNGREKNPHVTILFGLHSDIDDNDLEKVIETFKKTEVSLLNISIFECDENKEYDVVKFDIENKELNEMNKKLSEFPHTTDYPEFKPHITLAYVKSGEGEKYIKKLDNPIKIKPSKIVYSKADGSTKEYKFKYK